MGHASKKNRTSADKLFGYNTIYGAQDGLKDTPYMFRAWIGRLRFHLFYRGDQDPDCHDHPWGFWTFPLRSYVEEVLVERMESRCIPGARPNGMSEQRDVTYFERKLNHVRAFRLHYRPATYRHRVLGVYVGHKLFTIGRPDPNAPAILHCPGKIPTIVWCEKPSRKWGFTKERFGIWCWVPWKDYVFNGGKDGPCQ